MRLLFPQVHHRQVHAQLSGCRVPKPRETASRRRRPSKARVGEAFLHFRGGGWVVLIFEAPGKLLLLLRAVTVALFRFS